ncbi:hypothetical protein [Teredinibacter sp. KSP-S5-2]|uniref:hypothetical protein n=1 Tax=Teredinibacter sp. KSP-S5-2 TaxID=3034506 RepID=UPI002934A0E7|nr:hypothetical protein [Teredinibacter sp. KSP-S5-2]WNO08959.1 hypothetical protein P5V12_18595 [Teredinibacter sp. KSP-S5-2]
MKLYKFGLALAAASTLAMSTGCKRGYSNLDTNLDASDPSFYAAGTRWSLVINDSNKDNKTTTDDSQINDFRLRKYSDIDGNIEITITGTYDDLSSGFTRFNVDEVAGTNDVDENDTIAGIISAENQMVFLMPFEKDATSTQKTQILAFIRQGDCPSGNFSSGWMTLHSTSTADATDTSQAYFGLYNFKSDNNSVELTERRSLGLNEVTGTETISGAECANGIAFNDDNSHFFAPNSTALLHEKYDSETADRILLTFASDNIATAAELNESYVGLMYESSETGVSATSTISTTCSEGECSIRKQSNIATLSNSGAVIYQISLDMPTTDLPNGFITGTLTTETATGNLACAVDVNVQSTNEKQMVCIAQDPNNPVEIINFFFVSS